MPDIQTITPIKSTKGIISFAIIFGFVGMWMFATYWALTTLQTASEATGFLLEFAGASSVMGMIVLLVVQNFFRKTEAA